jgi:hypothetical protein
MCGMALAVVLSMAPAIAHAIPTDALVISEILFDPSGNDNGTEWLEIYNRSSTTIDLSAYSLGWGNDTYTQGTFVLPSFMLAPGATFVIGGATSNPSNGSPTYDLVENFTPNLRNGENNNFASAVALFLGDIGAVPTLTPVHALIYGESTASTSLIDEQGLAATILFGTDGFTEGTSIEWVGGENWTVPVSLGPGIAPTPEPGTGLLVGLGLVILALKRRRDRR